MDFSCRLQWMQDFTLRLNYYSFLCLRIILLPIEAHTISLNLDKVLTYPAYFTIKTTDFLTFWCLFIAPTEKYLSERNCKYIARNTDDVVWSIYREINRKVSSPARFLLSPQLPFGNEAKILQIEKTVS